MFKHQGREVVYVDDLVGHQQIAERTQSHGDAVHKWRQRFDDFPTPIADVGGESPHFVWDWVEVQKFLAVHPRLGGGR